MTQQADGVSISLRLVLAHASRQHSVGGWRPQVLALTAHDRHDTVYSAGTFRGIRLGSHGMTDGRMRPPGPPAQPCSNGMQPGRPAVSPTAAAPPDGSGEPPAEPLAEHPTLIKIREIRR